LQKSSKTSDQKSEDAILEIAERFMLALAVLFVLGGAVTWKVLNQRPDFFWNCSLRRRWQIGLFALSLSVLSAVSAKYVHGGFSVAFLVLASWCAGFSVVWSTMSLWQGAGDEGRITVKHLTRKTPEGLVLAKILTNPHAAPIGMSLVSSSPVTIPTLQRIEHTIITGATGQGKTTLLITLAHHAFLHRHPVIIIDPKGDHADIERMKSYARAAGRSDDEFKVFSLPNSKTSARYNPLLIGTPEQKKAKLMDGLDLEHQYYGSIASQYLGSLLDIFDFLEIPVSLAMIEKALLNKTFLSNLQNEMRAKVETAATEKMIAKLQSIRTIDPKDLAGLAAQICSFNSREFGSVLSPEPEEDQINLMDVINKRQIVYFQMSVNGYGDIARRIGKLIIQDLKTVSSRIHSAQAETELEFGACFIDEFGSFAIADFADFLKQVRSTKIGVHLFCQGIADLKAVSPEFASQVLGNTVTKIVFRTDLPEDAETWAGIAGTIDAFDSSYQVQRYGPFVERTGSGTQNPSKKMKVDFDVFKCLKRGQAVIIDKNSGNQDLISIWDSKSIDLAEIQKGLNKIGPKPVSKSTVSTATNEPNSPISERQIPIGSFVWAKKIRNDSSGIQPNDPAAKRIESLRDRNRPSWNRPK
jgi:hypothetical protein